MGPQLFDKAGRQRRRFFAVQWQQMLDAARRIERPPAPVGVDAQEHEQIARKYRALHDHPAAPDHSPFGESRMKRLEALMREVNQR